MSAGLTFDKILPLILALLLIFILSIRIGKERTKK